MRARAVYSIPMEGPVWHEMPLTEPGGEWAATCSGDGATMTLTIDILKSCSREDAAGLCERVAVRIQRGFLVGAHRVAHRTGAPRLESFSFLNDDGLLDGTGVARVAMVVNLTAPLPVDCRALIERSALSDTVLQRGADLYAEALGSQEITLTFLRLYQALLVLSGFDDRQQEHFDRWLNGHDPERWGLSIGPHHGKLESVPTKLRNELGHQENLARSRKIADIRQEIAREMPGLKDLVAKQLWAQIGQPTMPNPS